MNTFNIKRSAGATLAISLIILLLLTLLGIVGIRTTLLEERMSSNVQDKEYAFQATESALIEAENWLMDLTAEPIPLIICTSQPCVIIHDPDLYPQEQSNAWWQANGAPYISGSLNNVQTRPRYIIEFSRFVSDTPVIGKGSPTGTYYYRITARGTGASDEAQAMLQTTVAQRF